MERIPDGLCNEGLRDRLTREAERLCALGDLQGAESELGRLIELHKKRLDAGGLDLAHTFGMRGEVRYLRGTLESAAADFRTALSFRTRILGERDLDTIETASSLALVLWENGQIRDAEPLLQRTVDIRRAILGAEHALTLRTADRLEQLRMELAKSEEPVKSQPRGPKGRERQESTQPTFTLEEWSDLSERFGGLASRLFETSHRIRTSESAAEISLLDELKTCRAGFQRLCAEVIVWADRFGVDRPAPDELENVHRIAAVIDAVGERLTSRDQANGEYEQAISVLDQVMGLSHSTISEFAPLKTCQKRARHLRKRLAERDDAELSLEAITPFRDLMRLVTESTVLDDDEWVQLHQNVSAAFGSPLAAAATRGNLVEVEELRPTTCPSSEHTQQKPVVQLVPYPHIAIPIFPPARCRVTNDTGPSDDPARPVERRSPAPHPEIKARSVRLAVERLRSA